VHGLKAGELSGVAAMAGGVDEIDTWINFALTFYDGSRVDGATYFEDGFNDFIDELNYFINDLNTDYETDIDDIEY
jgi:hypothetical protein